MRGSACQTLVKTKGRFILCRRPAACDCAYAQTERTLCGLRAAICVLRPGAYFAAGRSTGRSTQISTHRPHGFFVCVRTSNSSYVDTHAARKWNCWKFRCAISGNTEKVEICSTRCGLRPVACGKVMNQSSQLTHSTFRAACGKVWTGLKSLKTIQ